MAVQTPTSKLQNDEVDPYSYDQRYGVSDPVSSPEPDPYDYDTRYGAAPALAPEPEVETDYSEIASDTAIDLGSGLIDLGDSLAGMASFLSGGIATAGMQAIGWEPSEWKEMLADFHSDERKRQDLEVEAAQGFEDTAKALLTNPRSLGGKVAQTAPMMAGIMVSARAYAGRVFRSTLNEALKKGISKKLANQLAVKASMKSATKAGAVAEGAMQGGSSFEQYMREGMDMGTAYVAAGMSAITTGLQAFVGGELGKKIGLGDIEAFGSTKGGFISRFFKGFVQEGGLEEGPQSAWETMWDNWAHDKPVMEGIDKAVAEGAVVGGFAGGGFSSVTGGGNSADPNVPDAANPDQTKILFKPTHTVNGIPVQQATKRGQILPDTYVNQDGDIVRPIVDDAVEQTAPLDLGNDVDAVAEGIKAEVDGAIEANPYDLIRETPMPTGLVGGQMDLTAPLGVEPDIDLNLDLVEDVAPVVQQTQAQLDAEIAPDLSQPIQFDAAEDATMTGEDATQLFTDVMGEDISYADDRSIEVGKAALSPDNDLKAPTKDQKEAGNYKKAHPKVQGFDVTVENPQGSRRRPEWPELTADYGYIKRTVGADSEAGAAPHQVEQVDVFVKHDTDIAADNPVYIIDQATEDGTTFDETKVMMGYESAEAASEGYLGNYTQGWTGLKNITEATPEQLKAWLADPAANDEYAEHLKGTPKVLKPVAKEEAQQADDIWYHGTGKHIKGDFKVGDRGAVFLSRDPKMAESFANRATGSTDEAGPNIMPVKINSEDIFDFNNEEHIARAAEKMKKWLNDPSKADYAVRSQNTKYGIEGTDLEEAVRAAGFDGYSIPSENGIAIFDPQQIRSSIVKEEVLPAPEKGRATLPKDEAPFDPDKMQARREDPKKQTVNMRDKEIQSEFKESVANNFDDYVLEYNQISEDDSKYGGEDSDGGRILGGDIVKELSSRFREDRSRLATVVHPVASQFTKDMFVRKISEPVPEGLNPEVYWTGGGTGAGKSTAIKVGPHHAQMKKANLVYDTNIADTKLTKGQIDMVLESGRTVKAVFVNRGGVDAFMEGVLIRAQRQEKKLGVGRTLPISVHVDTHVKSNQAIQELMEIYRDEPRVEIVIYDNSFGLGHAKEGNLDTLVAMDYTGVAEEITTLLRKEYEEGRVSEALYRGFTKGEKSQGKGLEGRVSGRAEQLPTGRVGPEHSPAPAQKEKVTPPLDPKDLLARRSGLPKGMQKVADDPRVSEVVDERDADGIFDNGGNGYWVYLNQGWVTGEGDSTSIHEANIPDILREMNQVQEGMVEDLSAPIAPKDLLARRDDADPYREMRGRELAYQVKVESTGKTATLTMDAAEAMAEADARVESLEELRRCI